MGKSNKQLIKEYYDVYHKVNEKIESLEKSLSDKWNVTVERENRLSKLPCVTLQATKKSGSMVIRLTNFEYYGLYDGYLMAEYCKCLDKWSRCPIVISIEKTDDEIIELLEKYDNKIYKNASSSWKMIHNDLK